jgi:hypothetical protein
MPFVPDEEHGGEVSLRTDGVMRFVLTRALVYEGATHTFLVPAGYRTDFATVPRIAVWLIPKFGKYTRAAILHDWLITDGIPAGLVSSVDTDGLFRRAMRELEVPPVRRWLMWAGVRWGAAFSSRRRAGWWSTAPQVLGMTVIGLPFAVPMVAVAAGLAVYSLYEFVATRGRRAGNLST